MASKKRSKESGSSLLSRVFGKKKDAPDANTSIQKLRDIEEMLQKKQLFLEKKIEHETQTAKSYGMKNKTMALKALARKKKYEKDLMQIDGTLTTIELQRSALENAHTNTEVLTVMGTASKALKSAHKQMDVDKVHDLMDDIAEQQDVAKEISEAISNPTGLQTDMVDEADLMKELEELEQEDLDKKLIDVGPLAPAKAAEAVTSPLPEVPKGAIGPRKSATPTKVLVAADGTQVRKKEKPTSKKEDDDMAQLAAWATG